MNALLNRRSVAVLFSAIALCAAQRASALTDLVTDGDFTSFTTGGTGTGGSTKGGQLGYNVVDSPWVNNTQSGGGTYGYNFLFTSAAANNSAGVNGNGGTLALWYSGEVISGFTGKNTITAPPYGGNFIASDPVYENSAISQVINGLVNGQKYNLEFYYGGAQQAGASYTTTTTEYWAVSLGSTASSTTAVIHNPAEGFTGWDLAQFQFTATATSEVLSFLAGGGPSGLPPFALLANVSLVVAPEPSTVFAGAFLLLPVGVRVARMLRKKAPAKV